MARQRDTKDQNTQTDPKLGDISDRLNDISSRLAAEKSQKAKEEKPNMQYQSVAGYSKGYRLISEFVAGILVGGGLGYGLDQLLGTTPWLLILLLLLGFVASVMNMWRTDQKSRLSPNELAKLPRVAEQQDEEK
jgi:ATP synthase protein I